IRLSWTLSDEDNWNATHRLAGKIWTVASVLIFLLAFFPKYSMIPFIPLAFIIAFVPIIYSYLFYLKQNKKEK
ncbi:MAG: SdpI family protein, partial [Clostridia bacterium]|nr:SdpI family protein [Clostridia bacterium]